jgi:hypothetical protein
MFEEKIISARRRNQHARHVRYPDFSARRAIRLHPLRLKLRAKQKET